MRTIQQDKDQECPLKCKWLMQDKYVVNPKTLTNNNPRMVSLAVAILALLALVSSDWIVQTAMAAPPELNLKLTGPPTAEAGQPLGINLHLVNPKNTPKQDARLRFFIHDGADRDLQSGDIKVDVQEGKSWVPVPLEPIDGAFMGVIGAEGKGHKEKHKRGGFAIPAKLNKLLHLRLTFRLPGVYSLVTAVSPDNGDTHLAQPSSMTLEAL